MKIDDFLRITTEYAARGVFAENDAFTIDRHSNRIMAIDSKRAAHLNGNNNPSKFVSFSDDTSTFHMNQPPLYTIGGWLPII